MDNDRNSKRYDLEERTLKFAKSVRTFVKKLPKTVGVIEDGKQVIRSSGSIGANYIEANEAISKKDFSHRIKISRKEAKETKYWLELLDCPAEFTSTRDILIVECTELLKILSAILAKV